MNKTMIFAAIVLLWACTPAKVETTSSQDTTSSDATKAPIAGNFPQLDVEHFTILDTTDIFFVKMTGPGDSVKIVTMEEGEKRALQQDTRVMRTPEGLQFKLKNGETKLLKENKDTEGEDFASYNFIEPMDSIGQWLLMGGYYEAWDYVLVDQQDGNENHLWGQPVMSPDGKYFLTGMVDLEAAFVPTGFQLWSFENNKPVLRWEKELTDWGSDHFIWTKNNTVIAEQTYRDENAAELRTRIIKMKISQ
ncbi:hypothetical protein KK083_29665 [Fulvivirgaceae bacterium PWU4]|uniref:Lipoprotein n=1 Tax=Chryseosolibacter histidini TaxID=2782349 RepID=A0AAP2DUA4_9BACT|nr:hypothetical protein [Chryseosolibacter histidini]MBT1701097.1 hypothetical protein [Chryseosolibacter histidini]